MPLLKSGEIIEDDWLLLEGDEPLPQGSNVLVSFARLKNEFDQLKEHNGALGVAFPNDLSIDELEPYLAKVEIVALTFPAFTDGRAFSQAKQLRTRFNFESEIRATGEFKPDQLAFLRQCGFDSFEVSERHSAEAWQKVATSMTLVYQRDYAPISGFAPANILDSRKENYDD